MDANLNNINLPWERQRTARMPQNVDYSRIQELYMTSQEESERTTFDETYEPVKTRLTPQEESIKDKIDSYEFWDTLCQFKEDNPKRLTMSLRDRLNLTDEQYDSLACIATAIATQETGMGWENEYRAEQDGLNGTIRKWAIILFSKNSASSGMTQLKIKDLMDAINEDKDSAQWYKGYFNQNDVSTAKGALGKGYDTLNNPEKSAVATMVALKRIMDNYDNYQLALSEKHALLADDFIEQGIDPQTAQAEGFEYLSQMYNIGINGSIDERNEIKEALQKVIIATDGASKDNPSPCGEQYNEKERYEDLQKILKNYNIELPDDALNKIKLALSSQDCEMDMTEYCAYAWNKGISEKGMQADRTIAEKIGIIFADSENLGKGEFDYAANVVNFATRYANQTTGEDGYFAVNDSLQEYKENQKI